MPAFFTGPRLPHPVPRRRRPANGSVADQVREYIDARPLVREALSLGIVNLSALARRIETETGLDRTEAIMTACRRYGHDPLATGQDRAVRHALRESRLEIRSNVGLLTYLGSWTLLERLAKSMAALRGQGERVHIFHGWEDVTVVADERLLDDLRPTLGREEPLERRSGLVELNLRSHDAGVPGFLAATTGALAARGINLIDAASCRQDHIFLIEEDDLPQAIAALDAFRR